MEILDNSEIGSESSSTLTSAMKGYLTETAKWGRFLAIISFISIAFIVLLAFSIGTIFSKLGNQPGMESLGGVAAFGAVFTVIYLLLAVLMFFPALYLFKFSAGILKSIPSLDIHGIESALSNLKSLFKFYGVFTIVILAFYGIIFLFAMIGALAS